MGSGHSHAGVAPAGTAAGKHKSRLAWALALTTSFMVAEVVGGLWTGSLALLADAAHMLTDAGGLALALIAIRFSERPATPQATYGYVRAEVLSALTNAVVLLLLTVYILYEAYKRFQNPPEIIGGPMLVVAVIGLIVNLISMKLLSARISPRNGIVPRHAAPALQGGTNDRIADVALDIQDRAELLGLFGRQPFIVDALEAVGVNVTLEHLHVMDVVGKHQHAARRIHDVVVEIAREPLP